MNLLLDIGNTRIKWATENEGNLTPGEPLPHDGKLFKDIARPTWKELEAPSRVIVSNVRGEDYAKSVHTWVRRRWKITPEFVRAESECCGVTNAYTAPARLGADRWVSMFAAVAEYTLPAIVVDCGTAITVDAIDANGKHYGGLIAPGLELMTSSLMQNAPDVELGDDETPQASLLGHSTEAAVSGGVLYAAISMIERVVTDLRTELGGTATAIITGGDAQRILPLLSGQVQHDPDLILKGLAVYAREVECVT